jgi:hypothetical protein
VNVINSSTDVVDRYGLAASDAPPTAVKTDHAEYTYISTSVTPCRKLDRVTRDASQCVQECLARKSITSCAGVQVVRAKNPAGLLLFTPNLPFVPYRNNVTAAAIGNGNTDISARLDRCMILNVHDRTMSGCDAPPPLNCNPDTLALADDDYVCFGVVPLRNQNNQVEEDYRISLERQSENTHCAAAFSPGPRPASVLTQRFLSYCFFVFPPLFVSPQLRIPSSIPPSSKCSLPVVSSTSSIRLTSRRTGLRVTRASIAPSIPPSVN